MPLDRATHYANYLEDSFSKNFGFEVSPKFVFGFGRLHTSPNSPEMPDLDSEEATEDLHDDIFFVSEQ